MRFQFLMQAGISTCAPVSAAAGQGKMMVTAGAALWIAGGINNRFSVCNFSITPGEG
jgi:hypothetical protein